MRIAKHPVVHFELHSTDQARACAFYSRLLRWRSERIGSGVGAYQMLDLGQAPSAGHDLGQGLSGGIVECGTSRSLWLPYVEVSAIEDTTERARALGAAVLLEPREGPTGWRSVISTPAGGEIALWQGKTGAEERHG